MNMVFKIVAFTFFINIAAGILSNPAIMGWQIGFEEDTDVYTLANFTSGQSDTTSQLETETNWAENLLGLLGLSFITDFLNTINKYLYGMVDIILYIIPADIDAQATIEWYLKLIISFIYTMGMVILFTGKKVNE